MYKLSKAKFSRFDIRRGDKNQIFRTIDSVMRLPPSAQSGICQQRAKEDNQRKLSDAACKQQQKRYKYVKSK